MIGVLCEHFHWPHDFYKSMGWRQLLGWLRERSRQVSLRNRTAKTDPDSWDGKDSDAWWAEMDARRARERGR